MLLEKDTISFKYKNIYDLTSKQIGIPIFQRFFAWKKDQSIQMLSDILETASDKTKDLYLLDFIYYNEGKKMMLADGQQRVVTLNLLFKAINDYIDENKLSIRKLNLFNIEYDIQEHQKKYYCGRNR